MVTFDETTERIIRVIWSSYLLKYFVYKEQIFMLDIELLE